MPCQTFAAWLQRYQNKTDALHATYTTKEKEIILIINLESDPAALVGTCSRGNPRQQVLGQPMDSNRNNNHRQLSGRPGDGLRVARPKPHRCKQSAPHGNGFPALSTLHHAFSPTLAHGRCACGPARAVRRSPRTGPA
jgi:hypothetical protein